MVEVCNEFIIIKDGGLRGIKQLRKDLLLNFDDADLIIDQGLSNLCSFSFNFSIFKPDNLHEELLRKTLISYSEVNNCDFHEYFGKEMWIRISRRQV